MAVWSALANDLGFIGWLLTMTQRTLRGTNRRRIRVSGFRARMRTASGRQVLRRRRAKGRYRLAVS